MLGEFKDFITRGNVVELAVAVVVGVAFQDLITSFVENLITPLIAAVIGEPDFSALTFTLNGSVFSYGSFLNALISFLTIAAVIFFVVVKPMNALQARMGDEEESDTRDCPECLSEIPKAASRCSHCGIQVAPEA